MQTSISPLILIINKALIPQENNFSFPVPMTVSKSLFPAHSVELIEACFNSLKL